MSDMYLMLEGVEGESRGAEICVCGVIAGDVERPGFGDDGIDALDGCCMDAASDRAEPAQ